LYEKCTKLFVDAASLAWHASYSQQPLDDGALGATTDEQMEIGETAMSTEGNKAVIRRYYDEVLNEGNLDILTDLAVMDYDEHDPLPGQATGLEGLRQRVAMLRGAFHPHFTIEDMIAEADEVAVRWTNRGVHVGEFAGMPPSGKSYTIAGIDIHRLRDGKMVEHWHVIDLLGQLQQLGFLPAPGQGGA
jgi:steroid delta-isomerase-like uncharacterized protein